MLPHSSVRYHSTHGTYSDQREAFEEYTISRASCSKYVNLNMFFHLDIQFLIGGIRAIDGLFGAVILDGQSYITTPNADYIPLPPFGIRHVKLRADSRYGDDDPTQWPQPYIAFHSHLAAIPRPNTLTQHSIIWWTPTAGDFICPPTTGPVSGLGKLCQRQYNQLRTSVIFLHHRVKKYLDSIPSSRVPPDLKPSAKWIEQVLDQLHSVYMSFRHIQFVVRDLQRLWLNTWALLDYMEIYKPRMDGNAPANDGVADTIGTYTMSIRVAQDMFLAGLPCWLIRPSTQFADDKIFKIGEIFHPKDYFVLDPHPFDYPVIFQGPATSPEKDQRIYSFARTFLCLQDPFAMSCPPSSTPTSSSLGPSQSLLSSTPAVASSSATAQLSGQNTRGVFCGGVVRTQARGRGTGRFSL